MGTPDALSSLGTYAWFMRRDGILVTLLILSLHAFVFWAHGFDVCFELNCQIDEKLLPLKVKDQGTANPCLKLRRKVWKAIVKKIPILDLECLVFMMISCAVGRKESVHYQVYCAAEPELPRFVEELQKTMVDQGEGITNSQLLAETHPIASILRFKPGTTRSARAIQFGSEVIVWLFAKLLFFNQTGLALHGGSDESCARGSPLSQFVQVCFVIFGIQEVTKFIAKELLQRRPKLKMAVQSYLFFTMVIILDVVMIVYVLSFLANSDTATAIAVTFSLISGLVFKLLVQPLLLILQIRFALRRVGQKVFEKLEGDLSEARNLESPEAPVQTQDTLKAALEAALEAGQAAKVGIEESKVEIEELKSALRKAEEERKDEAAQKIQHVHNKKDNTKKHHKPAGTADEELEQEKKEKKENKDNKYKGGKGLAADIKESEEVAKKGGKHVEDEAANNKQGVYNKKGKQKQTNTVEEELGGTNKEKKENKDKKDKADKGFATEIEEGDDVEKKGGTYVEDEAAKKKQGVYNKQGKQKQTKAVEKEPRGTNKEKKENKDKKDKADKGLTVESEEGEGVEKKGGKHGEDEAAKTSQGAHNTKGKQKQTKTATEGPRAGKKGEEGEHG